eukprot:3314901-Amphidinium_carterae.1
MAWAYFHIMAQVRALTKEIFDENDSQSLPFQAALQLTHQHAHMDLTSIRSLGMHMRFWSTHEAGTITIDEYIQHTRTSQPTTQIFYVTQDKAGLLTPAIKTNAPLLLVLRNGTEEAVSMVVKECFDRITIEYVIPGYEPVITDLPYLEISSTQPMEPNDSDYSWDSTSTKQSIHDSIHTHQAAPPLVSGGAGQSASSTQRPQHMQPEPPRMEDTRPDVQVRPAPHHHDSTGLLTRSCQIRQGVQ